MYAMLIHRKLGRNLLIGEIDAHVMLHALTHDLSDSIGSDLVRILKYSSPEFTAAVHKAEESMVCKLDERILSLYRLANIHKDWYIEAVVKAADFMSLYEYMWREKNMGNKEIEPFFQRMVADMKMMQRKLLKEKVESEFNRYRLALADLYMAMGNGIFNQNFVTS
jgi:5'-deoxynucleotidase YfbR-like HD superfamily hydrolase